MRVLVVDGAVQSRYLLSRLWQREDYAVDKAWNGSEALLVARQCNPDVVICDLLLPVMDGYTLLREWKADEAQRGIPFVVCTASYTGSKEEKLALDLGADAFILKPLKLEPFMHRVLKCWRRQRIAT